jgi:hypothetical protein
MKRVWATYLSLTAHILQNTPKINTFYQVDTFARRSIIIL